MAIRRIIDETDRDNEVDDVEVLFKDAISFSQFIERKAVADKTARMDAILKFCEQRLLDVDDIAHLISEPLKEKIKVEMISAGMAKADTSTLDSLDG